MVLALLLLLGALNGLLLLPVLLTMLGPPAEVRTCCYTSAGWSMRTRCGVTPAQAEVGVSCYTSTGWSTYYEVLHQYRLR